MSDGHFAAGAPSPTHRIPTAMGMGVARDVATRASSGASRTARWLALGAFALYLATGGGRIVGSDEVTMFEVARALLAGHVAVPEGATLQGKDGRFYSKNAAGQALLAMPLVAAGSAIAGAAHLGPDRRVLVERAVASTFNAAVTALMLGAFYLALCAFGVGGPAALGAALLLGFTTPVWVYAKSFMAEPLQALGLLLALTGSTRAALGDRAGPRLAALGALLAISAKLSMLPIAIACLVPFLEAPRRSWLWPAAGVALALLGHAAYDIARFGSPFETGYGAQATAAAYTTPWWVGVYGLLFSSGKGVAWYAPMLWLAPAGMLAMRDGARPCAEASAERAPMRRRAFGMLALTIGIAWLIALFLYGRFQHWAGDGSYGPRYLVPLLPLGFLPVAFALDRMPDARRALALLLAAIGLAVAFGGVAIYFGAEMREVGDYPYQLPLDHPHFMQSSHFDPHDAPPIVHWRMLRRNLGEHLAGHAPRLDGAASGPRDPRTGLSAAEQRTLLHGVDFWWAYAAYEGLPAAPLAAIALLLAALGAGALLRAARDARAEEHAP
jgi:hypothetical protein